MRVFRTLLFLIEGIVVVAVVVVVGSLAMLVAGVYEWSRNLIKGSQST